MPPRWCGAGHRRRRGAALLTCPAGAVASGRVEGETTEVWCLRGATRSGPSLRLEAGVLGWLELGVFKSKGLGLDK